MPGMLGGIVRAMMVNPPLILIMAKVNVMQNLYNLVMEIFKQLPKVMRRPVLALHLVMDVLALCVSSFSGAA